jgi:hypothetical protein
MKLAPKSLFLVSVIACTILACKPAGQNATYTTNAQFHQKARLGEITKNTVQVSVALEADEKENYFLKATFQPVDKGFHLYSKDMPEKGIDGIGRPTRFEIKAGTSIKVKGPTFTSDPTHDIKQLGTSFPVYEAGPVTLRLPVELPNASGSDIPFTALFSFMACDDGGECRPPVDKLAKEFIIPGSSK